ncbi:5'-nucleotidase C-terminal domain-containing protein [Roseibium sp. MMSF_3544]|uniref:5'-nucleotidase C-terminal domain-containing protein n=1 Tax=unclassified Roseibium TaxID=2629323 RepID=UPI00273EDF5D|nr:5'-nucleotidase C-terminal domain-containing protein [Roseibium sp. MMSF_3544]
MGFQYGSRFEPVVETDGLDVVQRHNLMMDGALENFSANLRGYQFSKYSLDGGLSSLFGWSPDDYGFGFGFGFGRLIIGTPGEDNIKGNALGNIIFGLGGNDDIHGRRGNDIIFGNRGDDNIKGGRGDDYANGGAGIDTLIFSGERKYYEIDFDAGTVTDLREGNREGTDTYVNVEFLQFKDEAISLDPEVFTLELLHFADQEANAATIDNIDNLSGVLNALRAEDLGNDGIADNTLTLSSGDAIIPGLFFDASEAVFGSQGIADIQIQNELGVQAIALGNHEFDLGTGLLAGLIDGSAVGNFENAAFVGTDLEDADFAGALFPYLSANLDFSTDPNLGPLEVAGGQDTATLQNVVTSSTISDVNGEKIAIIGATVPTIRSISSPGDDLGIFPAWASGNPTDAELDALAAILQAEVDQLLTDNPELNKVILLSHMQQISIEQELAARLENVDIIVAGGSNTRLFDDNDRIRDGDSDQGQYPLFITNAGGTSTAVVNTDGNYKYVGRLVIEFDKDGNIIPESYDENVSGAYATDAQGVADLNAEGLIDPEIDAITDAIQEQIVATESNVFGVSDVFLNGNRSGTFAPDDPDGVRTQETNLGNLTADANLAYAKEVDSSVVISIKNGGGIRANIGEIVVPAGGTEAVRLPNSEVVDGNGVVVKPEGGISQNDIATTLAFNNGLTLLDITKEELKAFLEGAVSALPTGVSGGFPQISGLKFSFDETKTSQTYDVDGNIDVAGERVINAGIFDEDGNLIAEVVRDGQIVGDPTESFRIVTLNFLANAGDEILSSLSNPNRVDLIDLDADGVDDDLFTGDATFAADGTEQDALAEYLDDNFNPDEGGTAYSEEDTGPDSDERIQNLTFRDDTVFDDILPPTPSEIVINEIRIDQPDADNDEYFELFGTPGASLDGLTYLVIGDGTGGSGVVEAVIDLSGQTLDENGYFVAAEATFSQGTADLTTTINFENGDNVTHLLVRDFTGSVGDDLDTDDDGTPETAPWSEIVDSVALIETVGSGDLVYSETEVGPDGTFVPGHVFRLPNGTGDWQIGPFDPAVGSDTPGEENSAEVQGPAELAIYEIQGAGHVSDYAGQSVRTTGIVTAVDFNGYYLQDPDGDGDTATSDAIFVFVGNGNAGGISVGDEVQVEGSVSEFIPGGASTGNLSITQISDTGAANSTVLSSGNALPVAVVLGAAGRTPPDATVISDDELPVNLQNEPGTFNPDVDGIDFFESLEGMRVTVDNPVAISATNGFDETWLVADDGAGTTPGLNGRGALPLNADADGYGDVNPERIQMQYDGFFDLLPDGFTPPELNVGDNLSDVTGVVSYSFGNFEVLVTDTFEVETASDNVAETTEIAASERDLTVATYNVLNVSAGPDANDGDQIAALAQQIVANLGSPDILALQEIQDDNGSAGENGSEDDDGNAIDDGILSADATLQALVDAIVAAGGPEYSFQSAEVDEFGETGGVPGGNIRNAFLYNEDRVEAVEIKTLEVEQLTDLGVTDPTAFDGTRDPLLGTFEFNGQEITLINNHFSSRFGSTPIFGGPQPFVQAGEDARELEAKTINEVVDALLAADANANVVVLGDLNTFDFTDELTEDLPGVGDEQVLTNLSVLAEDSYTFNFQGNSQALDHIFVTDGLLDGAQVDVVHTNVDFTDPTSDHEPIVASFNFGVPGEEIAGTNGRDTLIGTAGDDTITGERGADLIFGLDGFDKIEAGRGRDIVFGGAGDDMIFGQRGRDELFGEEGEDMINGGNGRDLIDGGADNDILTGGAAVDTFLFVEDFGDDVITDYEAADELVFAGIDNADLVFEDTDDGLKITASNEEIDGTVTLLGINSADFIV